MVFFVRTLSTSTAPGCFTPTQAAEGEVSCSGSLHRPSEAAGEMRSSDDTLPGAVQGLRSSYRLSTSPASPLMCCSATAGVVDDDTTTGSSSGTRRCAYIVGVALGVVSQSCILREEIVRVSTSSGWTGVTLSLGHWWTLSATGRAALINFSAFYVTPMFVLAFHPSTRICAYLSSPSIFPVQYATGCTSEKNPPL